MSMLAAFQRNLCTMPHIWVEPYGMARNLAGMFRRHLLFPGLSYLTFDPVNIMLVSQAITRQMDVCLIGLGNWFSVLNTFGCSLRVNTGMFALLDWIIGFPS